MANDGQIVFEVTADGKHAIADIKEITRVIQQETDGVRDWHQSVKAICTVRIGGSSIYDLPCPVNCLDDKSLNGILLRRFETVIVAVHEQHTTRLRRYGHRSIKGIGLTRD